MNKIAELTQRCFATSKIKDTEDRHGNTHDVGTTMDFNFSVIIYSDDGINYTGYFNMYEGNIIHYGNEGTKDTGFCFSEFQRYAGPSSFKIFINGIRVYYKDINKLLIDDYDEDKYSLKDEDYDELYIKGLGSTNFSVRLSSQPTDWNIEIKFDAFTEADDGGGFREAKASYKLNICNQAPKISDYDRNLGNKNNAFSINYTVWDQDNDVMTVEQRLNNKKLVSYSNVATGSISTVYITDEILKNLPLNQ